MHAGHQAEKTKEAERNFNPARFIDEGSGGQCCAMTVVDTEIPRLLILTGVRLQVA
jgi:hypothetical protein